MVANVCQTLCKSLDNTIEINSYRSHEAENEFGITYDFGGLTFGVRTLVLNKFFAISKQP
jgi:hypothetical protein